MATFTPLYKMRIFNFEDVMREMKLSHAGTSTANTTSNIMQQSK